MPWKHRIRSSIALLLMAATTTPLIAAEPEVTMENFVPKGIDESEGIACERWTLRVPERRADPESRMISLRFVRFSALAEDPGVPVVYLAGGPGGSGVRAGLGRRWTMFDRLRQSRDVILLDQRGTGQSDSPGAVQTSAAFDPDTPGTREHWIRVHTEAMREAFESYEEAGVDIRGYTTAESAADIEAVRQAIGARRINLLGISYGTHLALAYARSHPDQTDRLVIASPEGLDETAKLPARSDAYFERLQAAIDAHPEAAERWPDVRGLITRAIDSVRSDAERRDLRTRRGTTFGRTLGDFDVRVIIGYSVSDPDDVHELLGHLENAAAGDLSWFERWMYWTPGASVRVRGMPELMDLASGVSEERRALIDRQRRAALLDDALNFPMPHLAAINPALELDSDFREPYSGDRPALILSGTLDGRTFPEAHGALAERCSQASLVTVENAGHNLFFDHPAIVPMIEAFLDGAAPTTDRLVAGPPGFGFEKE